MILYAISGFRCSGDIPFIRPCSPSLEQGLRADPAFSSSFMKNVLRFSGLTQMEAALRENASRSLWLGPSITKWLCDEVPKTSQVN